MALIAPLRTTTARPLATRLADCGGVGLAFQVVRAIPRRRLLALATERLRLQLPILAAKLFDFLFQCGDASAGLSMHALPVACLLPQFKILTPQSGDLGTQGSDFLAELGNQLERRRQAIGICNRFEEESFHDSLVLASNWG